MGLGHWAEPLRLRRRTGGRRTGGRRLRHWGWAVGLGLDWAAGLGRAGDGDG
jgi:hypothetical protein